MSARLPWLALLASVLIVLGSACGADDSGGSSDSADASRDARRDVPDLGQPDTAGLSDADPAVDTTPGEDSDTSRPDVFVPPCGALNEACCDGRTCDAELQCALGICAPPSDCPGVPACVEPPSGTPDVPVIMRTGEPPLLAGGTVVTGTFELDQIEIYGDYTFSDIVESVDITSNGNSYGSLEFRGADWGFEANLDLYLGIIALGTDFGQPFAQYLYAGGCYVVDGNELASDLTECGTAWPEGTEPPDSLAFESSEGGMRFLLLLTKEMLIASTPEADRWAAQLAIIDDLPVVFTFSAAH